MIHTSNQNNLSCKIIYHQTIIQHIQQPNANVFVVTLRVKFLHRRVQFQKPITIYQNQKPNFKVVHNF